MENKVTEAAPLAGNLLGSPQGDFVIAEWQDPGAPPGPPRYIAPLHTHRGDDEAWYVLEGVLCIRSGDSVIEARAGSARLIREIHQMQERTSAKMKELFARFDSELLG